MNGLTYKALENSKNLFGEGGNNPAGGSGQLTSAQITNQCQLAASMGITHFLIHPPMDTNAQVQANYSQYAANWNLYTVEQYIQVWCDAIHAAGMKVVHRGTWSAIKANNGFALATYPSGTNYKPLGTVAGAATEGDTTYCGKMYRYLNTSVGASRILDGDMFCPVSEFTEYLANANYIWFDTSAGTQTGAYNFFMTMKDVVDAYATTISKTVGFFTIVNYSEYKSGYLGATLPNDTGGILSIDYYGHAGGYANGQHVSPQNYVDDWIAVRNQVVSGGGVNTKLWQTEMGGIFGDSWPTTGINGDVHSQRITTYEDSVHYQIQFWKAYRDSLVTPGLMNGVSNWGFWSGQNSSIVRYTGGTYYLNYFGQIYANFIKGNGMARIPVPQGGSFTDDSWGGRSMYF